MKQRKKRLIKQFVRWGLCVSSLVPSAAPIVAEAATAQGNLSKWVDFSLLGALTLEKLRLASGSNILVTDETGTSKEEPVDLGEISIATDSVLREPKQFYYDGPGDEADGILVQFDEKWSIQTYEHGGKQLYYHGRRLFQLVPG